MTKRCPEIDRDGPCLNAMTFLGNGRLDTETMASVVFEPEHRRRPYVVCRVCYEVWKMHCWKRPNYLPNDPVNNYQGDHKRLPK